MSIPSEVTINTGVVAEKAKTRKTYSTSSHKTSSKFSCPSCQTKSMRRIARKGFWQEHIASKFGFFPWECLHCRKVHLHRDRGVRRKREE